MQYMEELDGVGITLNLEEIARLGARQMIAPEYVNNDVAVFENKLVLDFSRPGKPTDNPYI